MSRGMVFFDPGHIRDNLSCIDLCSSILVYGTFYSVAAFMFIMRCALVASNKYYIRTYMLTKFEMHSLTHSKDMIVALKLKKCVTRP